MGKEGSRGGEWGEEGTEREREGGGRVGGKEGASEKEGRREGERIIRKSNITPVLVCFINQYLIGWRFTGRPSGGNRPDI